MESLLLQGLEPALPGAPQLLPLVWAETVHRLDEPGGWCQLAAEGRADPLVGVAQGLLQRQRQQLHLLPPAEERFGATRKATGKRRRWLKRIAGADRSQPGLTGLHLTGDRDHPLLSVEQKQVAAPAHQLDHQAALRLIPWATGKRQAHHPLPAGLLDRRESQTSQAVLKLLSERAALSVARGRINGHNPGSFGLPAQLQPLNTVQVAQGQLHGLAISLLRLLEATG